MTMTKAELLKKKLLEKKAKNDESSKPNPLEKIKQEKELLKATQTQINEDSKDPNKAILIKISKIGPLKIDGEIMHNRSGMSTKDQQELKNLAESFRLSKEGTLYNTGLIQAITVRPSKLAEGEFELIAGFRRVEGFKLNNETHIPAIITDVDDKTARRLRNAENKQRRAINAYDETYGELEEIQLYSDFNTIYETQNKLRKVAAIIKKENELVKKFSNDSLDTNEIIKNNSNYTLEEHLQARELRDVVKEITQKELTTFVNRLEILNINETIKSYLLKNRISYSEALALKKIAKDDSELITQTVTYIEEFELKNKKRMSVKEFENYLRDKTQSEKANRGHKVSPIGELKTKLNRINIDKLNLLPQDSLLKAHKIIEEMNSRYSLLEELLEAQNPDQIRDN